MSVLAHDFYDPADPDTLLGTLDDSQLKINEIRPALFELGSARIQLSRHLPDIDFIQKEYLVRTRIPAVDADAIWGWILKDGDFNLISYKEQGGENLTFTGPGLLYMLSWGRLYEEWYAPGQLGRGSTTVQQPGQWIWVGEPYGAILTRIIEEGEFQTGGPLQHVSHDFTREEDSNGNPWTVIADEFKVPTGTDMLTVANRLASAGDLYLELTPDLVLHAYQSFGRNLTGSFGTGNVRFQKGVNTQTEMTRKTRRAGLTHLITRNSDEVFALHVIPGFSGQAKYGFLDVPQSNDTTYVAATAQDVLASSQTESEEYALEITPGDNEAAGEYLFGPPGTNGHFWLGDQVTNHTGTGEHDLNAASQRVMGCTITADIAADDSTTARAYRSLHIVPQLAFKAIPNFEWRSSDEQSAQPGYCCSKKPYDCVPGTAGSTTLIHGPFSFAGGVNDPVAASPSINLPARVVRLPGPYGIASTDGVGGAGDGFSGGGAYSTSSTFFPASAGTAYQVSVYGKNTTSGTKQRTMRLCFYSGTHTSGVETTGFGLISEHPFHIPPSRPAWEQGSIIVVAPTGTTAMRVQSGVDVNSSFVMWDELEIYTVTGATEGSCPHAPLPIGTEPSVGDGPSFAFWDHEHEHDFPADGSPMHEAVSITVEDEGGYFDTDNVEAVLQELGAGGGSSAVVNTDGDPGMTIYVGFTDPSGAYTLQEGDVWIERSA
jgi:hypothetical protein